MDKPLKPYAVGQRFARAESLVLDADNQPRHADVRIVQIDTHYKGAAGKMLRYKEPLIYFEYDGLPTDHPRIRMFASDVDKLIHLERWIKQTTSHENVLPKETLPR